MNVFQLLLVSLQVMFSEMAGAWREFYDWFEEVVLEKPIEYRRLTYGQSWPYFKRAGLRLGDLAVVRHDCEALVVGI